jgi:ketosteroid isomerase-like protein
MALTAAFVAEAATDQSASATAVVDAFHDALQRGDRAAVMELFSPDAIILENGSSESRDEYQRHHLAEDIAFSRAVPSKRSVLAVHIEGDVAWIASSSLTNGAFEGKAIHSAGTELMVLTNSAAGWRIRAIHWSSHQLKRAE